MAQAAQKKASKPVPRNRLGDLLEEFLAWMRVGNASEYTLYHRRACIARFVRWAEERGIEDPMEMTRPVLERYQRYLYYHRQKNGQPLSSARSTAGWFRCGRWFRWLVRNNHILHNPASDLDMPRSTSGCRARC